MFFDKIMVLLELNSWKGMRYGKFKRVATQKNKT